MGSIVRSTTTVTTHPGPQDVDPTAEPKWKKAANKAARILDESKNPQWLLPEDKLPPKDQLNVINFIDTCGILTDRELDITRKTAVELVDAMASGQLTAVETVTAFLKRAHVGHQLVNLATEFMVQDSLEAAEDLDVYFRATGKIKGPLHGVPISTKEHIGHKGRVTHSSYAAWIDNAVEEDALIVQCAKAAGAVFHLRTNEPQSLMMADCFNYLNGQTVNPYNRNLSPGGSSGGEGASIALRCAPLGLGTDIGGSIRIPAAFCNTYGLRTTTLRNPYQGIILAGAGQESLRCVCGPLANSFQDIALVQQAILSHRPWSKETSLVPLPWKEATPFQPGTLTVGVMWEDDIVRPHPPVVRALKYAMEKLKAAGVNVVDFKPHRHAEAAELTATLFFPDAARTQLDILAEGEEPMHPLVSYIFGLANPEPISVMKNWEANAARDEIRDQYHALMKEHGVDVILLPAYPGPAAEVGTPEYFFYTAVWNLLDQPATVFPTGLKVDQTLDVVDGSLKPRSDVEEREHKKYSPEKFIGAPLNLQVVGRRYHDEELLAASELISKIVLG